MKIFPTTLRSKLTFWYATSTILLFSLLLGFFTIWFWYLLKSQIDHHIHIVINEAEGIVLRYPEHQREQLLRNLVSARGMTVVMLSPDGSPLLQTNSPDIAAVTEHEMQQIMSVSRNDQEPVHFTVSNLRFASVPINIRNNRGILAVGYSTELIQDSFTKIAASISLLAALSLGVAGIWGYLMISRYLKPLENMSLTAARISHVQNLSYRVSDQQDSQELKNIAKAFNKMLSQLQSSFYKEHDFFSDAAHTLKTPLAILRAQIENLTGNIRQKKDILHTIDSTVETIQDLLFISRIHSQGSLEKKRVNLSRILHELAELTETLGADKKLRITAEIEEDTRVIANSHLLKRALSNVAKNAVEHTDKGGEVAIKLHSTDADSGQHLITITNTGEGINQQDLPHLFERFYQGGTKKKKGSGLGLAITQAVVSDLGGEISIKSEVGQKTKIAITLPATSST
jgi:signal transduction histidine kinase